MDERQRQGCIQQAISTAYLLGWESGTGEGISHLKLLYAVRLSGI